MNAAESAFAPIADPSDVVVTDVVRLALDELRSRIAAGDAVIAAFGDAGTGKTSLSWLMQDRLPDDTVSIRVDDPLSFFEGVDEVVEGEIQAAGRGSLAELESESSGTHHLLVVVDSAQSLSPSSLEKLATFVSGEAAVTRQLVLLVRTPASPALEAWLSDRAAPRLVLAALDRDGTGSYVEGRLAAVPSAAFSHEAIDELHHHSGGIPLAIDRLAASAISHHTSRAGSGAVEVEDVRAAESGGLGSVGDAIRAYTGVPVSPVGEAPGAATPAATGVFAQALARSEASSAPDTSASPANPAAAAAPPRPSASAPAHAAAGSSAEAPLTTASLLGDRTGPPATVSAAEPRRALGPWSLAAAILLVGWIGFVAGIRVGEGRARATLPSVAAAPPESEGAVAVGSEQSESEVAAVVSSEPPVEPSEASPSASSVEHVPGATDTGPREAKASREERSEVSAAPVSVGRRWSLSLGDSRAALEGALEALYAGDRIQLIEFFEGDGEAAQPLEVVQLARKHIGGELHTLGVLAGQGAREEARILSIERSADEDMRVAYLPETARAVRLGGGRPDPFEGTHFLYDDFRPRSLASYEVRRGRISRLWGEPVTVVDTRPRYRSPYDRVEFVVARRDHAIFETRFYRGGSRPARVSETSRRDIRRVDDRVVPMRLVARDLRSGSRAEARVTAFAVDSDLDDSLFGLGRLRAPDLELPAP